MTIKLEILTTVTAVSDDFTMSVSISTRESDEDGWIELEYNPEVAQMNVNARLRELLAQHPEIALEQAYLLAVMEKIGYQGYLVPPELAPGVLAQLENGDATMKARIGNLDGWRYCIMKVADDDDPQANLD